MIWAANGAKTDSNWASVEAKYPDANVRGLWQKCVDDAQKLLGDVDERAVAILATDYLTNRARAVQESKKSNTAAAEKKETKSPVGGGRVHVDAGRAPANEKSELDIEIELARNLNKIRGEQ